MWNPDAYLEQLYANHEPKLSFKGGDWMEWRETLKHKLIELLGGFPPKEADLSPRVIEERQEFDEFFLERIEYTSYAHLRVPAYVLLPKREGRLPAVLACHGHGYGSKEIVGLLPDGRVNEHDPGLHKNFAVELVRRGFVVIAPDLLGFGDRRLEEDKDKVPKENSCFRLASNLLMMGQTLPGHRIYEMKRAIDYLGLREEVDEGRIGCMGISGGGLVGAFTSAVDERIKATVISCYANTFKESVMSMRHCLDNYIPGIIQYAEMPDLLGLVAPRPLFIESGIEDRIFPVSGAEKACRKLEQIYHSFGVNDQFGKDLFPGKHEIWGKKAYAWLEKTL